MRFVGYTLQFAAIVLILNIVGSVAPLSLLNYFTWIANVYFCINLSFWIIHFTQHYFYTAKVDAKNKAVLITGCDSGFGNAIAQMLDKRGYTVFACCLDRSCDGADELKSKCSNTLKIIQMDVTDDESVANAVRIVEDNLGKAELWAVINNAGVLKGFHTELSTMKDFNMCMQVNALGVVRVTKAFLPLLRKSKGRVVNICSLAGRLRSPFLGPYMMSKAAAVAFSEILMQEMNAFGVRVISIEPEFFRTPMCAEENVANIYKESLSEIDDDIKSAYGQRYIENAKRLCLAVFGSSSPKVERVFNAVESAVSLQNPAAVYKPTRNVFLTTVVFLGERVPQVFNELGTMIPFFIFGLPAPRTGIRFLHRFIKL